MDGSEFKDGKKMANYGMEFDEDWNMVLGMCMCVNVLSLRIHFQSNQILCNFSFKITNKRVCGGFIKTLDSVHF